MGTLSGLFSRKHRIPFSTPVVHPQERIDQVKHFLEVSERIERQFGIDVADEELKSALQTIDRRKNIVPILENIGIGILDPAAVEKHKVRCLRSTWWQRCKNLWKRFDRWSDAKANEGIVTGICLALAMAAFFVIVPAGVSLLWNLLGNGVAGGGVYFVTFMLQGLLWAFAISLAPKPPKEKWDTPKPKEEDHHISAIVLGTYLFIGLIPAMPLVLLASLIMPWFMTRQSGRSWRTMSVKEFFGKKAPWTVPIGLMDSILQAAPDTEFCFEALLDEDDSRTGEAFLAVNISGDASEKLYIWHGLV